MTISTQDEAIATAADLARREATLSDQRGALDLTTVQGLVRAGFPASFAPRRLGGLGTSFVELTTAVASIGEQCASAAWLASLWAYNARMASYLPDEGKDRLWEHGGMTLIVSSLVSQNVSVHEQTDGYRISGKWLYVSGVEFAEWALVGSAIPTPGDRSVRVFAVPRASFTVEQTWSTVGMRATGSHTLVIDDAHIPSCQTFIWDDMHRGLAPDAAPATQRAPLFSVNGLTFAGPLLGSARAAVALSADSMKANPSKPRAAARETHRIALARSAGEVDAATLMILRAAETADTAPPDEKMTRRNHRDTALAVEMLVGAVDRLVQMSGTRGLTTGHGLQRIWRDIHVGASHAALQFEPAALNYTEP